MLQAIFLFTNFSIGHRRQLIIYILMIIIIISTKSDYNNHFGIDYRVILCSNHKYLWLCEKTVDKYLI